MLEKIFEVDCNELARTDPLSITVDDDPKHRMFQYSGLIHDICKRVFKETYEKVQIQHVHSTDGCASINVYKDNKNICLFVETDKGKQKTKFTSDKDDEKSDKVLCDLIDLYDIFCALQKGSFSEIPKISDEPDRIFTGQCHRISLYREQKAFRFEKEKSSRFYKYG